MTDEVLTSIIVIDDRLDLRNAVLNSLTRALNMNDPSQSQKDGTRIDVNGKYELSSVKDLAESVTRKIKGASAPDSMVITRPQQLFDPYKQLRPNLEKLLLLIHLNVKTKDRAGRLERNGIKVYEEILARVTSTNVFGDSLGCTPFVRQKVKTLP